MPRFSLFRLVILLPILAGGIFAYYSYQKWSVVDRFNRQIEESRWMHSARELADAVGKERAWEIIEKKADEYETLVYDGETRFAQIVKCRHAYDNGNSDLCTLSDLENHSNWNGFRGFRIDSLAFDKDGLAVTFHIEEEQDDGRITSTQHENCFIKWSAGSPPPAMGRFYDLIGTQRQQRVSAAKKFYKLTSSVRKEFEIGELGQAAELATQLLAMAERYPNDWNYGNAIHEANMVLGRIAVANGEIEEAKQYLLAAGRTPGSPQLDSFGPNMSLALDLLELDETEVVLQYFDLCRKFWKPKTLPGWNKSKLDRWERQVKAGSIPDFGANLDY